MTNLRLRLLICLATAFVVSAMANAQPKVTHTLSPDGTTDVWTIREPTVNEPGLQPYKNQGVVFKPGDGITIESGGCVQTGGSGNTWKRYVDPRGDNSDRYYAGTVWIPGVLGNQEPNVTRINSVLGTRWGVPVNADPKNLYLLLGYLDDGYGDNGYYSHDDGTDDQCKGSQNAWVRVTAVRNAGGKLWGRPDKSAPFDLLSDSYDDNLIMQNPHWAYVDDPKNPGKAAPVAEDLCAVTVPGPTTQPGGPPSPPPGVAYYPDRVPCVSSSTFTERDQAQHWITRELSEVFDGAVCEHANWGPATYTGYLQFESQSTPFDDNDYSWQLYPTGNAGLVGRPTDRTSIEPEFYSQETIAGFSSPWWSDLRSAVDAGQDNDFAAAKAIFTDGSPNGKYVIMTGLMGLDLEHSIHAELHPVYAMAVRIKEDDPNDEHWAFFVRRFGNEGFCSSRQHYLDFLPDDQYVFRLPLLWGPNADLGDQVDVDFRTQTSSEQMPTISFVKGQGVFVTFYMTQQPASLQIIHGEIHLRWSNADTSRASRFILGAEIAKPATAPHASRVHPGGRATTHEFLIPATTKAAGYEEYYSRLIAGLSADQLAQLRAQFPEPPVKQAKVKSPPTIRITRANAPPQRSRSARHPTVRSVPDPAKVARDQELSQTILRLSAAAPNR